MTESPDGDQAVRALRAPMIRAISTPGDHEGPGIVTQFYHLLIFPLS